MSKADIRRLDLDLPPGKEPIIVQVLAMLQDSRRRTIESIKGVSDEALNWRRSSAESSIADLLYHIALVEADWLYEDVAGIPYPKRIKDLFPQEMRESDSRLVHVVPAPLDVHLHRLDDVRTELLEMFRTMSLEEFRRVRDLPRYDVTPEWILHHLLQHEAEHRGQIKSLRNAAARHPEA